MRVFIAIEFEQHIKDQLYNIQQRVVNCSTSGNFTRPENFHLTLKFIGEVQPPFINEITAAMKETAKACKPFSLHLGDLGSFPRGNKKIIWIGLKGELDRLNHLFSRLDTALNNIGIARDTRKYSPHITLGREVSLSVDFSKLAEDIIPKISENCSSVIKVSKISLMESTRKDGRLIYLPLYIQPLSD
ncbi:MAG: RNA 2',3'-cyclic phosphodiesterase [Clostridiales bacterium]|jgi:2'-5' RNA ligase|nr:RNA 2',3'-cyclic phosphodiesterase [Clostridiales bacterium]